MTDIYHNMTTENFDFGRRDRKTDQSGRAASPQAAVHLVLNILYSEGEYDRKAEVNGALGTERPTGTKPRVLDIH